MPGSKEENFKRNYAFSLYDIWQRPITRTLAPGVMKFTILVDPSLVINTVCLVCLNHAPEKRGTFFKKYINF